MNWLGCVPLTISVTFSTGTEKRYDRSNCKPGPIGVDEHQLDVGPPRDNVLQPGAVAVVGEDAVVKSRACFVGHGLEIDAVQVAKRREQVAIKARRPRVVEIGRPISTTASNAPPWARARAYWSRDSSFLARELCSVMPTPRSVSSRPGISSKAQEMIVRVDRRYGVERSLEPLVERSLLDIVGTVPGRPETT